MQAWFAEINLAEIIFYGAGAAFALAALAYYMRTEKPVRNAVMGMLPGVLVLAAAHFFGGGIGLAVPLNGLTAFIALVFGAPGVAAVCLIEWLIF